MSIKLELQSNNADLQTLIDKANSLPSVGENLDEELNNQDAIIAQIFEELEGKAAGEGGLVVSDDGQGNVTIVTNGADISAG